jgi:hypothetical protein
MDFKGWNEMGMIGLKWDGIGLQCRSSEWIGMRWNRMI